MTSTQFDDRFPYEKELKKDWQCAATLDDACARKQLTRLTPGSLLSPPKLMNVRSEALGVLPVLREAANREIYSGRRSSLKVPT
jgi:hypothetical protein